MEPRAKILLITIIVLLVLLFLCLWAVKKGQEEKSRRTKDLQIGSALRERTQRQQNEDDRSREPVRNHSNVPVQNEVPFLPQDAPMANAASVPTASSKTVTAPVLRCYDYFEFPSEGSFHVKTCGQAKAPGPTRLFVQWFPVADAAEYLVYLNKGPMVSPNQYSGKWSVPKTSYFFETDPLAGEDCWSICVTARGEDGAESEPSLIYSTCK